MGFWIPAIIAGSALWAWYAGYITINPTPEAAPTEPTDPGTTDPGAITSFFGGIWDWFTGLFSGGGGETIPDPDPTPSPAPIPPTVWEQLSSAMAAFTNEYAVYIVGIMSVVLLWIAFRRR